jgi:hypothetical protein
MIWRDNSSQPELSPNGGRLARVSLTNSHAIPDAMRQVYQMESAGGVPVGGDGRILAHHDGADGGRELDRYDSALTEEGTDVHRV